MSNCTYTFIEGIYSAILRTLRSRVHSTASAGNQHLSTSIKFLTATVDTPPHIPPPPSPCVLCKKQESEPKKPQGSVVNDIASDGGVLDTLLASTSPAIKSPVSGRGPADLDIDLDLDDLLGPPPQRFSSDSTTSTSPAIKSPVSSRSPADLNADLDLNDLLGPPPQRFSGGGIATPNASQPYSGGGASSGGRGWDSEQQSRGAPQSRGARQSFDGYGEEFGSARGAFARDANVAMEKAVKGDPTVTHLDVDDEGACPVQDKDVDAKTVQSLAARGIETFTPVQVGFLNALRWFQLYCVYLGSNYASALNSRALLLCRGLGAFVVAGSMMRITISYILYVAIGNAVFTFE